MKKILLAALIVICVTCAGCFQGGSNLIITDDGEVFMKNKLIGVPLVAEPIESFKESFENKPNADISPVVENNMSGYEVRLHYPSIENFAADGNSLYSTRKGKCKGIQERKGWFFDAYNFDLISSGEQNFSPSEAAAVQSMLSQVTFDLVIELPYSAESHNADKFDAENKILTWNLAPALIGGGEKHMRVHFKIWHRDKAAITLVVGLLLMASAIFFHVKRKSEGSESIKSSMTFKRNVFAGLFFALVIIAAYMLLSPVTFTDADIISLIPHSAS